MRENSATAPCGSDGHSSSTSWQKFVLLPFPDSINTPLAGQHGAVVKLAVFWLHDGTSLTDLLRAEKAGLPVPPEDQGAGCPHSGERGGPT